MLIFDIETNGFLDKMDRVHCMAVVNTETMEKVAFRPYQVEEGVRLLQESIDGGCHICGHNIIKFDLPALQKVFPWFHVPREKRYLIVDTLVLSRLIYPNVEDWDYSLFRKGAIPGKLIGTHKLEAWGYRLGVLKGTYGHDTENPWETFTEEMLAYNEQDVEVTRQLYERLAGKNYPEVAITLEHDIAWLMAQQERNGFPFNVEKAWELEAILRGVAGNLTVKLLQDVPPIPDKVFIPKKDNKPKGYVKGVPIQRYKEFNPNSRQQVEWLVRKHFGYDPQFEDLYDIPKEATDKEDLSKFRLKIDDDTFRFIKQDPDCPEELRVLSGSLEEYLMVKKRLGQLADGNQNWLDAVGEDGRIHGSVNANGAVTGRATHAHPNVAQVPKVGSPYGKECRELFMAPPGWVQVGVDASGLELRCLAHFMHPYDQGEYAHTVVNGDVHTLNQQAAGLPTRNDAKTFIYAFLYGAGDAKIGRIVKGTAKEGKRLKKEFLSKTPAIAQLKAAIEETLIAEEYRGRVVKWKRRHLFGLDGRALYIRSTHSALNTLLQSAGALICKRWAIRTEQRLLDRGLVHGWEGDFAFMAWVHDELQIAARTEAIAKIVVEEAEGAMRDTKEFFGFRVDLTTDGKVGRNWAETH